MALVTIDARDPTPIYAQLERALRAAIASGRLRAGDRLPTVREMAVDLRVNANTVARVYAELERASVIETRRGVGSFVKASPARARSAHEREKRLRSFAIRVLADAAAAGLSPQDLVDALRQWSGLSDRRSRDEVDPHQTKGA